MKNIIGVRFKIILLSLIILTGLAVISILAITVTNRLIAGEQKESSALKVSNAMLEARRNEKDFLLRFDLKYLEQNRTEIEKLKSELNYLIEHETNPNQRKILVALTGEVESYLTLFGEVVELYVERGLSQDKGGRGELRAAIHAVEERINKLNRKDILSSILMCRRHEKDYLLRGDSKYIDRFDKEIVLLKSLVGESVAANSELLAQIDRYGRGVHSIVDYDSKITAKIALFREHIHKIEPAVTAYIEHVDQEIEVLVTNTMKTVLIVTLSVFIISLILSIFFSSSIAGPLVRISRVINESSSIFSSASVEIAATAQEQVGSIESATSLTHELTEIVQRNMSSVRETAALSRSAEKSAESGFEEIEKMNNSMRDIYSSSEEIETIIDTIEEIARRTNILALNASIEAARAGERGKSFAVVAHEVKKLAVNSGEAAQRTRELIQQSLVRSQDGLKISETMVELFNELLKSVKKTSLVARDVEIAGSSQEKILLEVNEAIQQLDIAGKENANASEALSKQTGTITELVDELSSIVYGFMKARREQ